MSMHVPARPGPARPTLAVLACAALLSACAGAHAAATARPPPALGLAASPEPAVFAPGSEPPRPRPVTERLGRYKVGTPYQRGGRWYVPAVQPDYDETGLASWYGLGSAGRTTANGERFDENAITGAHPTLPMPCIVEVTNMATGRRLDVRLNDRSTGGGRRIIDLSRGAASRLGLMAGGAARVRVRYLGPASLEPGSLDATLAQRPAPLPTAEGSYGVQAAAFASRRAADRAGRSLASAGSAAIVPLDRGGVRLYRVVVGRWSSAGEAEQARERVVRLGFADARVVGAS